MRRLVLVAAAWVSQARPAAACTGTCPSPGWHSLDPLTESPIPRDGVVAFQQGSGEETCLDGLAPFLDVAVTDSAGASVAGSIEFVGGAGLLVFHPAAPWQAGGTYHARVSLDNEGLDPLFLGCGESVIVSELEFIASSDFSPPLPELSAPDFSADLHIVDNDDGLIACCSQTAPESDGSAGCDGAFYWPVGGCAALYESVSQRIAVEAPGVPEALGDQLLYQLVLDGTVVSRSTSFVGATRNTPACAVYEAHHLGTGETVRSPEVCTPPELAAILGLRLRDVAAELDCTQPVLCGSDDGWDPAACTPYDLADPPPPPTNPRSPDTVLDSDCPDLGSNQLPSGDSAATGTDGQPAEDSIDRGCTCDHATSSPNVLALALLLGLTRRRSRTRG